MLNGLCPWGDPLHVGHDRLYFICLCSLCFVYFLVTMLPYGLRALTNWRSALSNLRFRGWFANRESLKSDLCSRGKLVRFGGIALVHPHALPNGSVHILYSAHASVHKHRTTGGREGKCNALEADSKYRERFEALPWRSSCFKRSQSPWSEKSRV